MAAPIYRDEFHDRMQSMAGFVKTSVDTAHYDINRNTDTKFAALIRHYDEQLTTIMQHYDEQLATLTKQNEEQRKEIDILKEDGNRRERKLDALLKAMNVNVDGL